MDPRDNRSPNPAWEAERRRRDGRPAEASKIAAEALALRDSAGLRIAHALALLEQGETARVRVELEAAFEMLEGTVPEAEPLVPATASLGDFEEAELDNAFLEAESRPDEMWNANHVAEATLAQVEEGTPEGLAAAADSPFATATMAGLLERQGHADEAQALRAAIGEADAGDPPSERARIIATLERWLENLRRAS